MNLRNYEKLSRRTLNENGNDIQNFKLGMIGELGEIADVIKKHKYQGHELNKEKLKEEIGDFMWYYVKWLEINMQKGENKYFEELENEIKEVEIREDLEEVIFNLECISRYMFFCNDYKNFAISDVAKLIVCSGFSLNEVLEYNIEKLNKRYPQVFGEKRSVNREK
ncbi:MAG: hypothetical protein PWP15_1127 [Methanothermococcus sp.]|uniref:MazG nucleotide pyrophosphohydrolase domain-containing protein n=1 Tax=Methanothermococcus sp. TaxID=2614238 RepID=UPI00259073FC|nr:MazG nucleotide pyrophosphohydrolase domain-containing protein [Methanothermococcus sp.]MDK2790620.1 hypothetical protein [Methanothermococcus sp.]